MGGENLWESWKYRYFRSMQHGAVSVNGFYEEIENYNFENGTAIDPTKYIGHFTQVVWRSSRILGVGAAFTEDGKYMKVVCQYKSAGNYTGAYMSNVLPRV